ncbi:hypothetical protein H072_4576 [Dactylellina haptotyla CBS 200.50]|uniref:Spindle pole body component n=1 Tax=Dactylellina haptotyla (strain CBS 200.50) TaxID=1284197 RepID=S8AF48_DACHA|nr:hypothetical protein H072_4576 [Dactylellina haptotyla CBS 200.50]
MFCIQQKRRLKAGILESVGFVNTTFWTSSQPTMLSPPPPLRQPHRHANVSAIVVGKEHALTQRAFLAAHLPIMLHELFLVLAGHSSPLFTPSLPDNFPLVSPSERALLNDLASLGILHRRIRHACDLITTHHPSTVARAVACGIVNHLQKFRTQVTDTEKLILNHDGLLVGAYNIVPLAKIVSLFSGWRRVLEYMEELTKLMLFGGAPGVRHRDHDDLEEEEEEEDEELEDDAEDIANSEASDFLSQRGIKGAKIIDRLREDMHTGYPSIEELVLELLNTAELAWLRQVSTWVLYGRIPTFGAVDFMIREMATAAEDDDEDLEDTVLLLDFALSKSNVPKFVTAQTASSILFVGRALHQIRRKGGLNKAGSKMGAAPSVAVAITSEKLLLQEHLDILQDLKTPLSPVLFQAAINSIRDSLSRNTLQTLLPTEQILDVLYILREFYLLGRGEFAIGLVEQAEESIRKRMTRPALFKSKTGTSLGAVTVKDGEVGNVLKRTWAALYLRQSEEQQDDRLDRAREVLYLGLANKDAGAVGYTPGTGPIKVPLIVKNLDKTVFGDLLLGVPISLGFNLTWPLELFLTPQDLEIYQFLFHYLMAIRRAQMKLQALWQARRNTAVQGVALRGNKDGLKEKREKLVARERSQRMAWATANLCVFFLESLGIYFQGNVIDQGFGELEDVVGIGKPAGTGADTAVPGSPVTGRFPGTSTSRPGSRRGEPKVFGSMRGFERPRTPGSPKTPTFSSPARKRLSILESPKGAGSKRPETPATPKVAAGEEEAEKVTNPETLTLAHQRYLRFICQQTFITDTIFTNRLRTLLEMCEVLVTHVTTLMRVNEMLDLVEMDDSVEMENELEELNRVCGEIRGVVGGLVRRLHEMDEERDKFEVSRKKGDKKDEKKAEGLRAAGVFLGGAGIDKLLMNLDFATLNLGVE